MYKSKKQNASWWNRYVPYVDEKENISDHHCQAIVIFIVHTGNYDHYHGYFSIGQFYSLRKQPTFPEATTGFPKGMSTWCQGDFCARTSSLWFPLMKIPPQNVTLRQVTQGWVHPDCCTGARISLQCEILQRYCVNVKWTLLWNQTASRLEWVAHA